MDSSASIVRIPFIDIETLFKRIDETTENVIIIEHISPQGYAEFSRQRSGRGIVGLHGRYTPVTNDVILAIPHKPQCVQVIIITHADDNDPNKHSPVGTSQVTGGPLRLKSTDIFLRKPTSTREADLMLDEKTLHPLIHPPTGELDVIDSEMLKVYAASFWRGEI